MLKHLQQCFITLAGADFKMGNKWTIRQRAAFFPKLCKQSGGGLLDKLVFGAGGCAQGVLAVNPFSNSATEGTAPLNALGSESTSLVT